MIIEVLRLLLMRSKSDFEDIYTSTYIAYIFVNCCFTSELSTIYTEQQWVTP